MNPVFDFSFIMIRKLFASRKAKAHRRSSKDSSLSSFVFTFPFAICLVTIMTSTALAKDNTAVAPISTCTKLIKSVDPAVPHLSSSTVTSPLENNLGQLDITAFKELAKKFAVKARGQTMLLIESFAQFFDQVRASQGHTPFGIQQVEIYEQMEAYSKALLPNSRISSILGRL